MSDPTVEILGVYRLRFTDELLREQCEILYGSNLPDDTQIRAEKECREQLSGTVLIELSVTNRDDRFKIADFAQPKAGISPDNWQVAWAEAFLTVDGTKLLVPRWEKMPLDKNFRVAFFIHDWDPSGKLETSYGSRDCPSPEPMPQRLASLVPYELVD